jgi:hypothetical protein
MNRSQSSTVCSVFAPPEHRSRTRSRACCQVFALVVGGFVGQFFQMQCYAQGEQYFRLQLKHGDGSLFLGLNNCTGPLGLVPSSNADGGACELWRLAPAGGGWNRLQLKHGGDYLDAKYCSSPVGLNPGSDFENGACQLWRFVPAGDGWSRLQLKHGGQYLDIDHCSTTIGLNSGSTYEDGACQLWRKTPGPQRIDDNN